MNIYQNNMPSVMALQRHAANLFHVSKFKQKRNFTSKILTAIQRHLSYY